MEALGADALSLLGWWQEAGVDTLVDETPRDWLAKPAAPAPAAPPATAPIPAASPLPATIEALTAWLVDPANLPELGAPRIAPAGDPACGLMILADMPDPDDRTRLFDGATARLFDAMLAAIGCTRETVYLAPLAPGRPAGGRVYPALATRLAEIAAYHVALVRPRALVLFGQQPAVAFGLSAAPGRGALQNVNHAGGSVPAVATHHPRFLMGQPARKAAAWADLCALIEEYRR